MTQTTTTADRSRRIWTSGVPWTRDVALPAERAVQRLSRTTAPITQAFVESFLPSPDRDSFRLQGAVKGTDLRVCLPLWERRNRGRWTPTFVGRVEVTSDLECRIAGRMRMRWPFYLIVAVFAAYPMLATGLSGMNADGFLASALLGLPVSMVLVGGTAVTFARRTPSGVAALADRLEAVCTEISESR